jgi:acyl dehydratase
VAAIPFPFTYETVELHQVSRTHGRTITDTDISLYMMLTGGWHPVHCDREYMRKNGLGAVRAQGSFGIAVSLGSHLESSVLEGADEFVRAMGVEKWEYRRPLVSGDTFHLEVEIVGKDLEPNGRDYVVSRRVRMINQDGEILQEGVAKSMWRRDV